MQSHEKRFKKNQTSKYTRMFMKAKIVHLQFHFHYTYIQSIKIIAFRSMCENSIKNHDRFTFITCGNSPQKCFIYS